MKVILAFMTALLMLPVCATGTVASAADTEPGPPTDGRMM